MNPVFKNLLLACVLAVLATLAGMLGFSLLTRPGVLIVQLFVDLPRPYALNGGNAAHSGPVILMNLTFWFILFAAWAAIGLARESRLRTRSR